MGRTPRSLPHRRPPTQPEVKDGQDMKKNTKQSKAAAASAAGEEQTKRGRKPAGRSKGTGTLQKHGRTWRAVWVVDGKVFRRSTGTADKREAERRLNAFVEPYHTKGNARKDSAAAKTAERAGLGETAAALDKRAREGRATAGRVLVPLSGAWEAFDTSLARRSVSANVNRIYEKRWGVFLAWMERNRPAARGLADVDKETAEAFMREIRARSAPKTFNDYRALLSQVWRVLDADAGLDGRNPWRGIVPLPKETHARRELTVEELMRLTGSLDGEWRTLFALGIYTGLRLGDAVNLEWGAVDLARGFVQVTPHKTAKHGTIVRVPLFPALRAILAETPRSRRNGKILPGLAEEYREHEKRVNYRIRSIFEAAGIETQGETDRRNPKTKTARKAVEVGFHSLRHTFVSLCANAGVPLHIVQAIVGHTNAAMTSHYFHVSDDALRGAVAALPDVFTAGPAAALPAPADGEAAPVGADAVADALDALREACAKLAAAGLSPANWREAAAILADAKRRA